MRQPELIQLPKFLDERGNLSFFENNNQIPFKIKQVHWIFDVPGGEERGDWHTRKQKSLSSRLLEASMSSLTMAKNARPFN